MAPEEEVNETFEKEFDGVESFMLVQEILGLRTRIEELKERVKKFQIKEAGILCQIAERLEGITGEQNVWKAINKLQARIVKLEGENKGLAKYAERQERAADKFSVLLTAHRWIPVGEGLLKLERSKKRPFASIDFYLTDGKSACVGAYNYSADYWMCPLSDITHYRYITLPPAEQAGDSK